MTKASMHWLLHLSSCFFPAFSLPWIIAFRCNGLYWMHCTLFKEGRALKNWPKFVWGRQLALFYCPRILLKKKILKNDPLIVASLETAPASWIVRPVVHENVLACPGDSSQTIFCPSWGLRPEWKFEKVAECNSDQLMRDLAPATSGHCRGSFSWADWGPGRLVVNASINVARAKAGVANAAAFVTQFSL